MVEKKLLCIPKHCITTRRVKEVSLSPKKFNHCSAAAFFKLTFFSIKFQRRHTYTNPDPHSFSIFVFGGHNQKQLAPPFGFMLELRFQYDNFDETCCLGALIDSPRRIKQGGGPSPTPDGIY